MADKLTEQPDYTTMSGAEFQRAVGADPEKWAMAFTQRMSPDVKDPVILDRRMQEVLSWFADAMHAAQREAKVRLHGD